MTRKQQLLVFVGLAISVGFLWIAFRGLRPEALLDNIREANMAWLLLGAATYFIAVTLISLRWQFLLRAIRFIPLTGLIPLVAIGYMGNNVYPFRSGEALRIWLLQRNYRVPIVRATTTVFVERVFDGLVMLTFIIVPLTLLEVTSPELRTIIIFTAPLFLFALAIFFVLAAKPEWLRRFIAFISKFLPGKIGEIFRHLGEEIIGGLEGLRSPTHLAGAVFFSYASWMVEALVYWMVSFAFDLNVTYPMILLVVGAVNLAGLIPASPGQIGVYEFFVRLVLVALGIDEVRAASYALVVHIVIWLPVTLLGFFFLARQGLGWNAITHAHVIEEQTASHEIAAVN